MIRKIIIVTMITMFLLIVSDIAFAASITVAAHDSTPQAKKWADLICDGVDDYIELLASIANHAGTYSVEIDLAAAQTITATVYGRHSVEWLAGTYNLGSSLIIPDASDCVIEAEGTHLEGPDKGSALIIRGMNRCRYYFGTIKCNSTDPNDAAIKIKPTSSMPAVFSQVSYTGLNGIPHSGAGLLIDPSSANVCSNHFVGTDISDLHTGILVNEAAGKCHTNWFWVSYIKRVYRCIYEKGTNVERNVWDVNVEANLKNSEAIRTAASHGKWYVIMGTYRYEGINNALVLEPGASHNVMEIHPPIENFAWEDNSGNSTNVILSTKRAPYKKSKEVKQEARVEKELEKCLVGWWNFDEGKGNIAGDKSPNKNNGTIHGARWIEGKVGSALEFDGVDDYVKISNFGKVAPTDEITVLTWVKLNSIKDQDLFSFVPLEANNRITVHFPWDNAIHWQFGNPYKSVNMPIPEGIDGVWQHFAFVSSSSGDFMKIYRNSVKGTQVGGPAFFGSYTGDWYIAGRPECPFKGAIDEVAVFSVALSEDDIKRIMEKGVSEGMKIR